MDEIKEKRLIKRFSQHALLEIRGYCRMGSGRQGELTDCSEGGVGLFSREAMKRGEVILVRVCDDLPPRTSYWSKEAGRFHMITVKVRWCQEGFSTGGEPGFRMGLMRLPPFHG